MSAYKDTNRYMNTMRKIMRLMRSKNILTDLVGGGSVLRNFQKLNLFAKTFKKYIKFSEIKRTLIARDSIFHLKIKTSSLVEN